MKKVDLKNKTEQELKKILEEKRQELLTFKFGTSGSRTKNVKAGRTSRREIARILTALHNKMIMAE
ncbi:MAG: 50S ribosomal protein L29 [Candidatus Paceibacterota bacterium]|jgi:ribosomal protein L29